MSQAKREMERLDSLRALANSALQEAGAIEACEYHEDVLIDQGDDDAAKQAYAIGTNMVKADKVDGTRQEFMDAIQSALQESYDHCPYCARASGKD